MNTPFQARTDWQTVGSPDGDIRLFSAQAVPAPRAVVVVLQEAFGVNAHIQSVACRFAAAGFYALAPDLFHRTPQHAVVEYDDREVAMALIADLGADAIVADVGAVLTQARELNPELPAFVCGFCFGARAAFTAACSLHELRGGICFYGPGIAAGPHAVLDRISPGQPPLLLFYGADDPTIPAEHVEAIARELERAGSSYEQVVYPEAGHAFSCDARPAMYRPSAALDAWMRALEFIDGAGLP